MDFRKISELYLAHFRVLWAQKQCCKFQDCGLSTRSYWDSKLHARCLTPLTFCRFLYILWQLQGVIILEQIISLCWNFQDNPILSSGKVSSESEMGHVPTFEILVHLTWNVTHLDLSKASGPDCIPVVVLKDCEPELSYILAELVSKS